MIGKWEETAYVPLHAADMRKESGGVCVIKLDINCDMGEGFGRARQHEDLGILKWITSVNIACGLHAGDPHIICRTVEAALKHGVKIGAHPGYPDVHGFGRRPMHLTMDEVYELVLYQVAALDGVTRALGGELHHVKLHGALYNEAAERRSWPRRSSALSPTSTKS
jgi:UPF0271 protein